MPDEKIEEKPSVQYTPCPRNEAFLFIQRVQALNVCRSRGIEANAEIMIRGFEHHGSAVHPCKNPRHHESKCECVCGYKWTRFQGEG